MWPRLVPECVARWKRKFSPRCKGRVSLAFHYGPILNGSTHTQVISVTYQMPIMVSNRFVIDILSKSQVKTLAANHTGPCVSIFLPTHRAGPETRQDPVRLKNLLRQTGNDLAASGLKASAIKKFLAPAWDLVGQDFFWQHQDDGLAIFVSKQIFSCFRLPLEFQELAVVAPRRFHLKPLFPLLTDDSHFYVLALSQNHVKIYQATRTRIREVEVRQMPKGLRDLMIEEPSEIQLQYHTAAAGGAGGRSAIYHGHSAGAGHRKIRLLKYFREIDQSLHDLLQTDPVPLVVATVDYLFAIYREANTCPKLIMEPVRGNPDELSAVELHTAAWKVAWPLFAADRRKACQLYEELAGTSRATADLAAVFNAAQQGRIEFLFVPVGVQRWGTWDRDKQRMEVHEEPSAENEDLLNLATLLVYAGGGKVYAAGPERMPGGETIAAVLRY